ncbi:MAG: PAS domain S-box protein [Syntrophales bacterium]|jgi:diguanylate cyclase (GGDEF)-like protein/PAS domain S-box-containing protein|nr:PAS domain S-box protein [Syntrophales bacterium]MDD4340019.1 PAS domain S-box protein [Syntrophales bacterium]HOG07509.1 PAS domain S-box protein [Syntrophales bacterium]HOS77047.1 PAS domain S-box protein [Syntrophales bacterium]HPB70653.1 PAS domain S-box protein [Syntrophales bacterium]
MRDEAKTKRQLIEELCALRRGRAEDAARPSRPAIARKAPVGIQGNIPDISERKRMEEALRESEERFRTLFLQAPIGIFIYDRALIVTDCNERFARIVRSSRDRIVGLDLASLREPAVIPHLLVALDNRPSHYEGRYRAMTSDADIWVSFNVNPLHNAEREVVGGIGAVEDVTDRVKMASALRVGEERYRQMVEKANDIILRCDRRGCFTFVNPATERITGYAASDLLGRSYLDFIPPDHRGDVTAMFTEQFAEKTMNTYSELPIVAKDGRTMWFGQNSQLILDGDRIEGWQVVSRDITDRKRMEEELRRLSISDQLTGLYNRRGFMTLAEQQLKLAVRVRQGFLLYFADMDNLKAVNDRFGHYEGDRALIQTAAILKEVFRASDIVARIGGDEFAVLAVSSHLRDAEILKLRLNRRIEAVNAEGRNRFEIALSLGVALFDPAQPRTLDDLMSEADELMYAQKNTRK